MCPAHKVARIPGIGAIARPALALAIAVATAGAVGANAWISAALSTVVFCVVALIVDRGVLRDLRWVAGIKSHVAEATG